MAVSPLPAYGFTLTLPNTTALVAVDDPQYGASALAVPDNCQAIVVYNMASANRIFVKFMVPPGIPASVTVASSTVIPALSSMTFDVGSLANRMPIGSTGALNLYFLAESGAAVPVNITYLMGRGSATP